MYDFHCTIEQGSAKVRADSARNSVSREPFLREKRLDLRENIQRKIQPESRKIKVRKIPGRDRDPGRIQEILRLVYFL